MAALLTGLIMIYVGASPVGMICSFLIMSSAPQEKAGSAGSLSTTAGEFGAALRVAVMGVIGTTVYRTDIRLPGGLPTRGRTRCTAALPRR
jgi:MFS transporter, DHA2 family, multidrug resistance protein